MWHQDDTAALTYYSFGDCSLLRTSAWYLLYCTLVDRKQVANRLNDVYQRFHDIIFRRFWLWLLLVWIFSNVSYLFRITLWISISKQNNTNTILLFASSPTLDPDPSGYTEFTMSVVYKMSGISSFECVFIKGLFDASLSCSRFHRQQRGMFCTSKYASGC